MFYSSSLCGYRDQNELSLPSSYMICPSNQEAVQHILRYMDEVLELFSNPPLIHIGADGTYHLGSCATCRSRVETTSKSALFIDHLNKLATHALAKGCRPIAWADHALKYPEALDKMNRDMIWADWDYWTTARNPAAFHYWKTGKLITADKAPQEFFAREGRFALDGQGGDTQLVSRRFSS